MPPNLDIKQIFTNPIHFLSFGFGSGLAPKAPGTAGTVVAIPIYLLMSGLPLWLYGLILAIMIGVGIWLCDVTEQALGVHDYKGIVWDEIVGYLLTMFAAPASWLWIIIGFVLFRVFDIWKPWPISWANKHIDGGLGVVVDDLMAALPALIILQGLAWFVR